MTSNSTLRPAREVFNDLPETCLARNITTGEAILIIAGESGYHPATGANVAHYNRSHGITAAQVAAMMAGSMFGWRCPAADPRTYSTEMQERLYSGKDDETV